MENKAIMPNGKPVAKKDNNNQLKARENMELKTCDGKVFKPLEFAQELVGNYKGLVPSHSTVNVPYETHTFLTKLNELRYVRGEYYPLVQTVTSNSIIKAYESMIKSGLAISDGQADLIPYGTDLSFMPRAKGRVANASATVIDYGNIISNVVYKGEEINSHYENGVEIYDHKRDMTKRSDCFEDILGCFTYYIDNNGVIKESLWKSTITLCKDWLSNEHKLFKDSKTNKKVYPKQVEMFMPHLSENHINRPEQMCRKTGEASMATIVKAKYPHNDFQSKFLNDIIQDSNKQGAYPINEQPTYNIDDEDVIEATEVKTVVGEIVEKQEPQLDDLPDFMKAEPNELACADCGLVISQKVFNFSASKYGRPLCFECQNKNNK